jgi:hypothetical protein
MEICPVAEPPDPMMPVIVGRLPAAGVTLKADEGAGVEVVDAGVFEV